MPGIPDGMEDAGMELLVAGAIACVSVDGENPLIQGRTTTASLEPRQSALSGVSRPVRATTRCSAKLHP